MPSAPSPVGGTDCKHAIYAIYSMPMCLSLLSLAARFQRLLYRTVTAVTERWLAVVLVAASNTGSLRTYEDGRYERHGWGRWRAGPLSLQIQGFDVHSGEFACTYVYVNTPRLLRLGWHCEIACVWVVFDLAFVFLSFLFFCFSPVELRSVVCLCTMYVEPLFMLPLGGRNNRCFCHCCCFGCCFC